MNFFLLLTSCFVLRIRVSWDIFVGSIDEEFPTRCDEKSHLANGLSGSKLIAINR